MDALLMNKMHVKEIDPFFISVRIEKHIIQIKRKIMNTLTFENIMKYTKNENPKILSTINLTITDLTKKEND